MNSRERRSVLVVTACTPFHPSGVVRIEQYRDRLHADGFELRTRDYHSRFQRRYEGRVIGPRRLRNPLLRQVVRVGLRAAGYLHVWTSCVLIAALAPTVDAVLVQWILLPRWLTWWVTIVNGRLIYDFDDPTFLEHPARAEVMVRRAWRVVAGSHLLFDYAIARNPNSFLIPSPVPLDIYPAPGEREDDPGLPCIGWIGSSGTLTQLQLVWPALERLASNGARFQLLIAGAGGRHDLIPSSALLVPDIIDSYEGSDLPGLVSRLDIGIMPLRDGAWERGKSAMKAIIYMAGARPVVASPVGEAGFVIEAGRSGYLPETTEEWMTALHRLLDDPAHRQELGERGRQIVAERYSVNVCYRALWSEVLSRI